MPGIIVFRRRWSVGSDDLIVPAVFLVIIHLVWLLVLGISLTVLPSLDQSNVCQSEYTHQIISYSILWSLALVVEILLVIVSLRGTILEDEQRWMSEYLLYVKLVLWLAEIGLTIASFIWVKDHYFTCDIQNGYGTVILGLAIFNTIIFVTSLITIWCVFDVAGRSWVKLKNYQKSLRDQGTKTKSKLQYKRSGGNSARSWRHRKVRRAYQNSWDSRCQILFCCVKTQNRKSRSSFADIARVLSEFFRDLDVVPSDVVVGLVLLRQRQQLLRFRVIHQSTNSVYQFLSGVRVTPDTQFLDLKGKDLPIILEIHHYMHFAVGMYGWPMYLRKNTGIATFRLCSSLRCGQCLPCCHAKPLESVVVDDNCCGCNFAAYKKMCHLPDTYVIYITYHVDVGETPFLIAIDYSRKSIVLSIRGTLSLQDVLTDLNAEGEPLPIRPVNEEWIGHKGMVNAAAYIYKKVKEEHLLTKAFNWDKDRGTHNFQLVCVGHSLGGGTAAILSIMLKQEYPDTRCFSFSPPGGLLSQQAVEFSRPFITSVVLGKDVVPRIGLHQLESLRHNLIYAIHKSTDPKWKTLTSGLTSSVGRRREWTEAEVEAQLSTPPPKKKPDQPPGTEDLNIHPWDSTVNLSVHQPLYPPGRIIHLVRQYPRDPDSGDKATSGNEHKRRTFKRAIEPTYRAMLADNKNFDEVLISKRMVQDHMPDNVLDALEKILAQNNIKPTFYVPDTYEKARRNIDVKPSGSSHSISTENPLESPQSVSTCHATNQSTIVRNSVSTNLNDDSLPFLNQTDGTGINPENFSFYKDETSKIEETNLVTSNHSIPGPDQDCQVLTTIAEIASSPKSAHEEPDITEPTCTASSLNVIPNETESSSNVFNKADDTSVLSCHQEDSSSNFCHKMALLEPQVVESETVMKDFKSPSTNRDVINAFPANSSRKSQKTESRPRKVLNQLASLSESVACPSADPVSYDTTYPVFTGQTEYGQESVHIEPFYRYRVYSESKV